jgi:hypothetical protein
MGTSGDVAAGEQFSASFDNPKITQSLGLSKK